MLGVVVVDGGPHERAPEVLLHLRDQGPSERLEVDFAGLLGADDEAELALLAMNRLSERLAIESLAGAVELARGAVALDAVAFEIGEVAGGGKAAVSCHRDVVRFDEAATPIRRRRADVIGSPPR